jgi:hypothetical protein
MEANPSPTESEKWLFYNKNRDALHIYTRPLRRRRYFCLCASLAAASVLGLVFFWLWTSQPGAQAVFEDIPPTEHWANGSATVPEKLDPLDPLASLNGPPTAQFRGWRSIYF